MDMIIQNISLLINPTELAISAGYIGIFIIIFAETGVLLGIFLPGDSLLFAAGLLASNGIFNPILLIAIVIVAAILGDTTSYWLGVKSGKILLNKYPRLVKQEYIHKTEKFYSHWGGRAVIFARFVPIVRTIAPLMAGIGYMEYKTFVLFNIIGSILWGPVMILLGYTLGKSIPNSTHYILPISIGIIVLSFLPFFIRILSQKYFVRQKTSEENIQTK